MTNQPLNKTSRLISIDAFRASIMVLMIFVNDLWTLVDIPTWLGHVSADTDGMGLADIVFPAFLFIVGLSVPYAIESRKKKGDTNLTILYHIISRTTALLVMGLFLVNADLYDYSSFIPRPIWMILLILSFFLIWNAYQNSETLRVKLLKGLGIVLLISLALFYKTANETGVLAMGIHWWGILGLIGWAYFIASCIYLFSNGAVWVQIFALIFFLLFSSASYLGWLTSLYSIKDYVWIVQDGSMPAFSMAGIVVTLAYKNLGPQNKRFWFYTILLIVLLVLFGVITRPIWGISKIKATPSWTAICSGIAIAGFIFTVFITDVLKKTKWYNAIKPAGTSTLTSYLIPYVHYALIGLIGIQLPLYLRTGAVGIGKSFIYALIIVAITGLLEKRNIRLKI